MSFESGYFALGLLLIGVAVLASFLKRLPLTETMIYLLAGIVVGPIGLGWITLDAYVFAKPLERLAEVAVIISLFTTGLKMRVPLSDGRWWVPVRLAFVSMTITVGAIALVGVVGLGMSAGAAVLLGALLAPTDPVLAAEVQLESPEDRDRLRFALTGEAGFNDGTAFPFVMLGLGMLGLHPLGTGAWRWLAIDVLWAIIGGLAIGALCGAGVARLVLWLRRQHREAVGHDEFIALGLIALSYGAALLAHAYGFLAVFAAGLALRTIERRESAEPPSGEMLAAEQAGEESEIATDPQKAPAHMVGAVLGFNVQIERIAEVVLVLVIGMALSREYLRFEEVWFIALLFLVIRPVAVMSGLVFTREHWRERLLVSWFGIRGIGSIYYLMYAVNRGLSPELVWQLSSITLTVIAVSIFLHGITVTPLMAWHRRQSAAGK